MAIPDFPSIMLPLLQRTGDEKKHKMRDVIEHLAKHFMNNEFKLTEEERTQFYPSGYDKIFSHRVTWAKCHLNKAGLVETHEPGHFQITKNGLDILHKNPPKIDMKLLRSLNIPEYIEFVSDTPKDTKSDVIPSEEENTSISPMESIEYGHDEINKNLSDELLSTIKERSSTFFEELAVNLMLAMGYGGTKGAGEVTDESHDEGVDGVIKEDKLGLDVIYLQAKRWQKESTIGRPEISGFVGSLTAKKCNKGVFVTTSTFTKEAKEYIKEIPQQVVLIDGSDLTKLMIKYNVGVSTEKSYEIKKMDSDYFKE